MTTTEKLARIGFREEAEHDGAFPAGEHDHDDPMSHAVGSDDEMLDDDHGHDDEDDGQPSFAKKGKRKSKSAMTLIVATLAVFFVVVLGGGSFIIYKNKQKAKENASEVVELPAQPAITALPATGNDAAGASTASNPSAASGAGVPAPLAPAPAAAAPLAEVQTSPAGVANGANFTPDQKTAGVPAAGAAKPVTTAPVRGGDAPAASGAASNERSTLKLSTVETPSQNDSATAANVAANAAANASMRRDITAIQEVVKSLAQQIASIKDDMKATAVTRAATSATEKAAKPVKADPVVPKEPSATARAEVVKSARKLSKRAVVEPKSEAAVVVKTDVVKEEIIAPPSNSNRCVTAIVNNLAYITRRSADGTESEQTVVAGDKIDGRTVVGVDSRSRTVMLDGGGRITTNCQK